MEYEAVIGLEVHAQLLTNSKMFCACDANYQGQEPNTHTCPICLGMPGVLPVINAKAVEQTIMVGLALHCQIAEVTKWDRKNYHYPDLPKGYQISQYDLPLARNGFLEVSVDGAKRQVGIRRVHLEEDTGRLYHEGNSALVDFNRSGVPLMEIVSEPDIRTPEEARQYLQKLRTILRYLGVSSGDMEAGAFRVDANVSVRPRGQKEFGAQVEVKNMNSFRSVKLALEYEMQRQSILLTRGEKVVRETRGWVETEGRTVSQRSKEEAHDYRYFPEPDLPPLEVRPEWVEGIRARLPELPDAKAERFQGEYGLSAGDAETLVADKAVAAWFERAVMLAQQAEPPVSPKTVANWVTGELFRRVRSDAEVETIADLPVTPEALVGLLVLVERGTINNNVAKQVLDEMSTTGKPAAEIVLGKGLAQISDEDQLAAVVGEVLDSYPDEVQSYLNGKETVAQWLMGQVMRATRGKANPQVVRSQLTEQLKARREKQR
ncbi:MAG: Asp-tRNA(Asn)/Glu-tRNA(Gln) amidotransferase subunit GatB [Ardenticatenaceae bacterium]|nr:Asp-tRNA(Asn)/Glu-tRNA(Gln) amidotransferase subunit GatB [Ardenticatenaceae bacterium]